MHWTLNPQVHTLKVHWVIWERYWCLKMRPLFLQSGDVLLDHSNSTHISCYMVFNHLVALCYYETVTVCQDKYQWDIQSPYKEFPHLYIRRVPRPKLEWYISTSALTLSEGLVSKIATLTVGKHLVSVSLRAMKCPDNNHEVRVKISLSIRSTPLYIL